MTVRAPRSSGAQDPSWSRFADTDVANIGMWCIFPGAPTFDAYGRYVGPKVDATSDPPEETWDEEIFYDPASTATDRVYCKRGGYLGPIARFNPRAHRIVPFAVEGGEPDQIIGHTMPAAGSAGLIKAALALYHQTLAPTHHCQRPNPMLGLDKTRNTTTGPAVAARLSMCEREP